VINLFVEVQIDDILTVQSIQSPIAINKFRIIFDQHIYEQSSLLQKDHNFQSMIICHFLLSLSGIQFQKISIFDNNRQEGLDSFLQMHHKNSSTHSQQRFPK